MKKFIFLYMGYEAADESTIEQWMAWFKGMGDAVVDMGNPFGAGKELAKDGGVSDLAVDLQAVTGYSIVNAQDMDAALALAKGCPAATSVRVYEAMAM